MATAPHARPRRDPIHTGLHSLLAFASTLIGLLVLAYAILWITKGRFLKPYFERYASHYAHRTVTVGGDFQLYFNPHVHFRADGLAVANPPWAARPNLFTGRSVELELHTLPLILGHERLRYLMLDGADADLEWNTARQNTWTMRAPTGKPTTIPEIERAAITNTRLTYADPQLDLKLGVMVGDVGARNTSVDRPVAFHGQGTARGTPFTLAGKLTAPNATLRGGRNDIVARVDVGDSRLDITGTLPGATVLEGSDLKLHARGGNFATPFKLLGVTALATRRYDVTSDLTKAGIEWRFTRIHGRFGDSDLAGRATVSLPNDRLLFVGDLRSAKLDILDVGPWIGIDPGAIDRLRGKAVVHMVAGTPRVIPDAPLDNDSIDRFDARIDYHAAAIRTGNIPLANLHLGVDLNHSLLKLAPFDLDVVGGRLNGAVTLNARRDPVVTDYDLRLSTVPLGRMMASLGTPMTGTSVLIRGRVQLRGTGNTMRRSLATSNGRIAFVLPSGTIALGQSELVELNVGRYLESFIGKTLKKPANLRCGLVAFTVRGGQATADPVLIDADRTAIRATGGFSFTDESLRMQIKADSKRFSLFSGQSPIGLGGYFAKPAVHPISGQLLTRVGAAVVLGVVATPFAALAPFIDLGDGKSSACGPLLAGAHADAQRTISHKEARRQDGKH